MNLQNLKLIFDHYIDKFEYVNDSTHREYYKWQIAKQFRPLMDEALACPDEEFVGRLKSIKKLTENLIDSYTQPFQGLIAFAERHKEVESVRNMFKALYGGTPGDVADIQKRVSAFLTMSHELKAQYEPDSYLYKNDMHSVTGYLFLYDPDHYYFYKASHAKAFADCIEFYDDWGEGESVRLDVYYRMCNQLVDAIKADASLLATDASRFTNGWGDDSNSLHPDSEKHILAFDLIYCCSAYGLFDGITFERPKAKERQLIQERKKRATKLADRYEAAKKRYKSLLEAKAFVDSVIRVGNQVVHKKYGEGVIAGIKDTTVSVVFPEAGEKKFGILVAAYNGLIDFNNEEFASKAAEIKYLFDNEVFIKNELKESENALSPYLEYID